MSLKTPFFVTGLPRTRSAWLANLFSTDSTVCFHEPAESVDQLVQEYPWLTVGVADSTLPLKHQGIIAKWPEARWLFVERDPDDAQRSFIKFTREHYKLLGREVQAYFQMHERASSEFLGRPETMMVRYEDLERPEVIAEAWKFLLPGVQINAARLQVLMRLNVQQDLVKRLHELPKFLAKASE